MAIQAEALGETEQTALRSLTESASNIETSILLRKGVPEELVRSDVLQNVEIIGIREGGLVECFVPFDLIDNEEVPVKEEWATSLARQMGDIAEAEGGTGQHVPVTLGYIEGEPTLKIMDGFHRSAALRLRGENRVYSTLKVTDWNDLYDFRIFTAKDHAHVRFSRVVQWIREVWNYSGLEDKLTVEQAVLLYRFESNGAKLGLNPEDVEKAKAWVAHKEAGWEIAAMTIHGYLKVAESVDPRLVHSTREKRRGDVLDAPTQNILKIFADELPNDFRMQNLVMNTAKIVRLPRAASATNSGTRSMSGPEVRALCQKVKEYGTVEKAAKEIAKIDWKKWEPEYGETKQRALRRAHDPRYKGASVLEKTEKEIADVRERIRQSKEREEEINDFNKKNVREARDKAQELIHGLGSLIIELSELIGEKPPRPKLVSVPTTELTPATPARPTMLTQTEKAQRQAHTAIDEHEGLIDVVGRQPEHQRSAQEIHEMVDRCLRGFIEVDDIPEPVTASERRQFRVALAQASAIPEKFRVSNWKDRFKELRLLENPNLADVPED